MQLSDCNFTSVTCEKSGYSNFLLFEHLTNKQTASFSGRGI